MERNFLAVLHNIVLLMQGRANTLMVASLTSNFSIPLGQDLRRIIPPQAVKRMNPVLSSPSSVPVPRGDDKVTRDQVDHTIFFEYEAGRTQRWHEELPTKFGLGHMTWPVTQRKLLFNI